MSSLIGTPSDARTTSLIRAMGAREIGHGIAILSRPDSAAPLWSRVAGDAADLAFLGTAYTAEYANQRRLLTATAAVVGITALDVVCAQRLGAASTSSTDTPDGRVIKAITINKPVEQVYGFWQQLENLPRFMRYVDSVEELPDGRSRWRAQGPGGVTVQWDAETIARRENELIAWRSLPGSRIHTSGTVRFRPAPGRAARRSTSRWTSARRLAHSAARSRGSPDAIHRSSCNEDLRRLKQLLETGEIAVSEGEGLWRPGRPTGDPERVRSLAGVQP